MPVTASRRPIRAGISAEIIDPAEARIIEPSVNPTIIGAVRIPDASIDPFTLTTANLIDARRHGAVALTYHEVVGLIVENARVIGVKLHNNLTGENSEAYAPVTVNAAGIWGTLIAKQAGVIINMFPAKGSLLIFGHRVNNMVLNRCRKPANGDILVPDKIVSMLGTTSDRVPITEIDNMRVTPAEVEILLSEGVKMECVLWWQATMTRRDEASAVELCVSTIRSVTEWTVLSPSLAVN